MHHEKTLDSQQMFSGKIVEVWHDRVALENGKTALREVVRHPGAVGVLVREGSRLVLVRQFRYAVGRALLEVCAGKLEPSEPPESAALRELREETGIVGGPLVFLGDFYASPGVYDEVIHLYYTEPAGRRPPAPDEDEFVSVCEIEIDRFEAELARGEIRDGKTVFAWALAKSRGLLDLSGAETRKEG